MKPFLLLPILFSIATTSAIATPDPFMGEGKQGYINRCIASLKGNGLDPRFERTFCNCMADRLEANYPRTLASISPSDTVIEAQRKMTAAVNAAGQECIRIMEGN